MRLFFDFIKYIGYLTSFFYTAKIGKCIQNLLWNFYAGLMQRRFKSFNGRFNGSIDLIGGKYIEVGNNTLLGKDLRLWAWSGFENHKFSPSIQIGNNSAINSGCMISCINRIVIGNGVGIASNCVIVDNTHGDFREHKFTFENNPDIPDVFLQGVHERVPFSKGPVVIEDGVHIGEGAIVMPGVIIGHHSIISAHTVVTKKIHPYSIVAGDPAMIVMSFNKNKKNLNNT